MSHENDESQTSHYQGNHFDHGAVLKGTRYAFPFYFTEKLIAITPLSLSLQVLAKILHVCEQEDVEYTEDGLEAIVFTAQGDMRQALNNLQSTHEGFGLVKSENVFKVCDEPHPLLVKDMLSKCAECKLDEAYQTMQHLWRLGYSAEDIITNMFRVCKTHPMAEYQKLEFIKEIGYQHMRIVQGTSSLLQMAGLIARLCQKGEATA